MRSKMAGFGRFLKRNVYYLLLILCVAVIATIIAVTLATANNDSVVDVIKPGDEIEQPGGDEKPGTDPEPEKPTAIIFDAPVRTGEIGMDYSATEFVFSSTMNQMRIHKGIDFVAEAGTDVYAVYEGVVETVSTDAFNGTMIVIKHNDDLKTVYKSLERDPLVKTGDRVRKGDVIGKVGNTTCFEVAEGAHLHFEVLEKGALADPYVYLLNSEK